MGYLDYVNVQMGTASVNARSFGNTNPLIARPFGMNHFFLQTRNGYNGDYNGWMFHPDDVRTTGIRLTHIPSPWIGDYARLIMMPTTGNGAGARLDGGRESSYDVNNAVMKPNYLGVKFIRYGINVEFAPTVRGGAMRFTWDDRVSEFIDGGEIRRFFLDYSGTAGGEEPRTSLDVDYANGIIRGYTNNYRPRGYENAPKNFRMYFVFRFDSAFAESLTIQGKENVCLVFEGSPRTVNVQFATSFISLDQAEYNLTSEVEGKTLEEIRREGEADWESYLSRIEIEADEDKMKTFYSCLYRSFLFPRMFHEICPDGVRRHFSPCNGKVCEGPMYVDNGFWDTYKTVYPLYSIIAPSLYRDMCQGFVNFYREGGWLPRWTAPSAVNCMPGTAIDAVFGDAAVKGVVTDEKLLNDMLRALLQHADNIAPDPAFGRDGLEAYKKFGYVSDEYKESVNKTLDYAYGDFCISRVAAAAGDTDTEKRMLRSAKNYKKLFDADTGFMRAKNRKGERRTDFSQFDWGGDYTEGGPWQSSFAVYHDFMGYAKLLGGRDKFLDMIQRLFDTPMYFKEKGYGCEIHEMTEAYLENGFGQCALSNQPSFHVPYLFACMGDRDRTAYWVRKCVRELFRAEPKGFPGDEDNGSMATWYVFSALGFYPVCPGVDEYVLAAPSVKRAVIHLEDGNVFTVSAPACSDDKDYASRIALNGAKKRSAVIKHSEIFSGGELRFTMSDKPSGQRYSDAQLPFSMTKKA